MSTTARLKPFLAVATIVAAAFLAAPASAQTAHYPQVMPAQATTTTLRVGWIAFQPFATRVDVFYNGEKIASAPEEAGSVLIEKLEPGTNYPLRFCSQYEYTTPPLTLCYPQIWIASTLPGPQAPPPAVIPPDPPAGLAAESPAWNRSVVRWNAADARVATIRVSRGGLTRDLASTATSFVDEPLPPNTPVEYQVCFVNTGGEACGYASTRTPTIGQLVAGDFTGDGKTDIALVGASARQNVPIAASRGDGNFDILNSQPMPSSAMSSFSQAAQEGGRVVAGDFNGDGMDDLALTGTNLAAIMVAFSQGDGTFTVTYRSLWSAAGTNDSSFMQWSRVPGVQVVAGDFNGDGMDDLGLAGGPGWASMPVALSFGGMGTFFVRNDAQASFPSWAATPGATLLAGNFGGQGDAFALTGPWWWATVPYGAPTADGSSTTPLTFQTLLNTSVARFPQRAAAGRVITGDLDGNGITDIASVSLQDDYLTVLLSDGVGYHSSGMYSYQAWDVRVEDWYLGATFGGWAKLRGAKALAGDFDGDGRGDVALVGPRDWDSIPVAFSRPMDYCPWFGCSAGWMEVTNMGVPGFSRWAYQDDRLADTLVGSSLLLVDRPLRSRDGRYDLVLQSDGNLVLYANDATGRRALWATGTDGQAVAHAVMQTDGNLVLYDAANHPLWSSNTYGNPGAYLWLQDDGNLVIYRADRTPIWATGTVQP